MGTSIGFAGRLETGAEAAAGAAEEDDVGPDIVVVEVAEECNLPIETDKEEVLHIRKSRKKRNAERKWIKWLGVIFDDSLGTESPGSQKHVRKALGALSGVGGSQWGMCHVVRNWDGGDRKRGKRNSAGCNIRPLKSDGCCAGDCN